MKKSLKIAITGGIGSGKTTVLNLLRDEGYTVVSLDAVYSKLLDDQEFVIKLSEKFGIKPAIIDERVVLDRKSLSEKVFAKPELLNELNNYTHHLIFESAFKEQGEDLTFYEVPLLFEGKHQSKFDAIWVVVRNLDDRISSAVKRDGDEERVLNKIKNQVDYDKMDLSLHTIIKNDGDLASLKVKVKRAVSEIKRV